MTDLIELAKNTPAGMAHISGTGPEGKTCRECVHWAGNELVSPKSKREGVTLPARYARRRWRYGQPAPQACLKYRAMRRAQIQDEPRSRRVPHDCLACSHFVLAVDPQPVRDWAQEKGPGSSEGTEG